MYEVLTYQRPSRLTAATCTGSSRPPNSAVAEPRSESRSKYSASASPSGNATGSNEIDAVPLVAATTAMSSNTGVVVSDRSVTSTSTPATESSVSPPDTRPTRSASFRPVSTAARAAGTSAGSRMSIMPSTSCASSASTKRVTAASALGAPGSPAPFSAMVVRPRPAANVATVAPMPATRRRRGSRAARALPARRSAWTTATSSIERTRVGAWSASACSRCRSTCSNRSSPAGSIGVRMSTMISSRPSSGCAGRRGHDGPACGPWWVGNRGSRRSLVRAGRRGSARRWPSAAAPAAPAGRR